MRTPLELIYGEWTGVGKSEVNVCSWVEQVEERLALVIVREYYEIFSKSGNKFLTKKFLRHCVCKGIS